MPHVHTRLKAQVDLVQGAELQCNICTEWKTSSLFRHRPFQPGHGGERYETRCRSCDKIKARLFAEGKSQSISSIRQVLDSGIEFIGALNQARHTDGQPRRKPRKLSTQEREERRERREEAAGKPSLCYLVGMEGDRTAVKIGHSTNVYRRLAQYQAGNPRKLIVLALLPGGQTTERELHQKFMHYHKPEFVGEWFEYAPEIMNHFAAGRIG